jgi:hypothetical protein
MYIHTYAYNIYSNSHSLAVAPNWRVPQPPLHPSRFPYLSALTQPQRPLAAAAEEEVQMGWELVLMGGWA